MEPLLFDVKCTYHGIHFSWSLVCPGPRQTPFSLLAAFKTDATHAHPVYRPGRFKLPGRFIPSQFVCVDPGLLSRRLVRRLRMLSLSRSPPVSFWLYGQRCGPSRAGEGKIGGKISVKCQFAKYIWNFSEKGECGALAMILLSRLSRLRGPDVL